MNYQTVRWVLIGLLVITGVYLVIDHGQHLAPYLPFAFLLGCLFMHLFGHGSHDAHDHRDHGEHPKKDS
ncbi:hypothetical protein A2704_05870 [Candidatus Kaiserbacteria bacterium RIFCSPHIGHO2_01_FULL_54_36b]|uniref:DUF2933 domain-containing protein n=1 Tax=Candidatus Kaiserbacteria bacterium RIFCSPHIGHO2_01_FULL_54_36b TaxID=1798483 RepID=A0A1F6CMG5_9BACT|nr:MAG: hypothetical protein A2704_05870 [Candidatus Kaiserbacteria bacterium RIFCSPHIGHO2_01_FULL_54_36b]